MEDLGLYSIMAEKEVAVASTKKKIRLPPSVPFLWEEWPGIAKKDWKPEVSSITTVLAPLVKLVPSIPFNWEEKPGKPLSCITQPPSEPALETPKPKMAALASPILFHTATDGYRNHDGGKDNYGDEEEDRFDFDLESFSFDADDSFNSAPSLLANCMVPSAAILIALPMEGTDLNDQLETTSSPASETDSSTSSYATGISSLVGTPFLERLFPLYPPNSSFLGKAACSQDSSLAPPEQKNNNFNHENNSSIMVRKPPTLGELIMMSRRRSCQRKAAQMRKQDLSMEFPDKKTFGCCIFGTGIQMIEGFQRKRHQLSLKLI